MAAIGFACSTPTEAVAHYRAGSPGEVLRARGHTVVVSDELQQTPAGTLALALADAGNPRGRAAWEPDVVVLTGGWASGVPLEWIPEARAEGQRVVVDIDDWPWMPLTNPHYNADLPDAKLATVNSADALVVSTGAIDEGLRGRVLVPVFVARNRLDASRFEGARALNLGRAARYGGRAENPSPLVVGYRGAVAFHLPDIAMLRGSLPVFVSDHDARVVHVGHDANAASFALAAGLHPKRVETRPLVTFGHYPPLLAGVDVAVAPLGRVPFSLAKSNIACLEWVAAGVPVIASEHPEYRKFTGGVPGTIANNRREWLAALASMLDPLHRESVRATQAAVLDELEPWTLAAMVEQRDNPYETMLAELGVADARPTRGSAGPEGPAGKGGNVTEGQLRGSDRDPQVSPQGVGNRK